METAMHVAHFGNSSKQSKVEVGDLVTLVGKVSYVDGSDGSFKVEFVNPLNLSDTVQCDAFIDSNMVCRPSPTAFDIDRQMKIDRLKELDKEREALIKELGLDDETPTE